MPDRELIPPSLAGAILLLGRKVIPHWGGWPKTVAETLALVDGCSRSQAYLLQDRLLAALPGLVAKMGRPPLPPPVETPTMLAVVKAVRDYAIAHPGSVNGNKERRTYTDAFRRFVVGLMDPGKPGEHMHINEMVEASGVPLGTLKDWLSIHSDQEPSSVPEEEQPLPKESVPDTIRSAHLRLIIRLWQSWKGTFQAFCHMVRTEHRLPYGPTFIGSSLQGVGLRNRKRSKGPVEAPWSHDTFRTLFPGAQWLGDGTTIALRFQWGDQIFVFNVEQFHDPAADGIMGLAVTDAEDSQAVCQAFEGGVETAGKPPVAATLDNKPCNHCPSVQEVLGDTILLASTPNRGQAKAPIEGAFGLFKQAMSPLVVKGVNQRERARCALILILEAWARGRNGKPRSRFKGLTPAEFYASANPTPEEVEDARRWFQLLQRQRERASLTREARRDPVRLDLLENGLKELGISDPDRRLAVDLAYYSREAIVRGLATFRAKQELGKLPAHADPGRYLGGIIRKLDNRLELELISIYLLSQRLRLRDLTLAPLQRAAERLLTEVPASDLPRAFVDRALESTWEIDFRFWSKAAEKMLSTLPSKQRHAMYKPLCRRISASFATALERREDLIDRLAAGVAAVN